MRILHLHSEFCNYQITFRNNTPRTILWLKDVIGYFIKRTDVENIHEINLKVVTGFFLKGKAERNWSAKTIKTRMSALGLFFNWCVKEGHLEKNPIKELPIPRLPKRIPKHLSVTQAYYIIEWLKSRSFRYTYEKSRAIAIFTMFIYTGMRLGELLNLKLSEVMFDEKTIMIRAGKGNKDRSIPIIFRLEIYLKKYLIDRNRINPESIYFFVSLRKLDGLCYNVVKRLFDKITKETKIHVYPHKLRHSYAVQMLEGGCDIFTLSKLLGHSDIKTTTIYLTASDAQKQRQAEKHPLY